MLRYPTLYTDEWYSQHSIILQLNNSDIVGGTFHALVPFLNKMSNLTVEPPWKRP